MRYTPVMLGLALTAAAFLPGCRHTTTHAPPAEHATPFIAGSWSQPVNGIRMGVRPIIHASAEDGVWLLVVIENTTPEEVGWPGIIAEDDVRLFGRRPIGSSSGENLRIVAEPLEGQPIEEEMLMRLSGLQRQMETLAPGEIRLHGDELQQQQMMQQVPDQVEAESVYWPGLEDEAARGAWRLHLTYRPDGFPPPPGEEGVERAWAYNGWEGRQIDLPPVVVEVWPLGMRQSRQEMR